MLIHCVNVEGVIFCMPLKQAKTKASSGKPASWRDGRSAIEWLIAGNPQHLFRIIDFAFRRHDDLVGNHVLVERRGHGARIAAEIDDDGCGPIGENLGAGMLGVTVDVDQNIDLVAGDLPGGGFIGELGDVAPAIDDRFHARLCRIVRHRFAAVIGVDFDTGLVMQFQHFPQCKANGVIAQVRRHVTDTQPLAGARFLPDGGPGEISDIRSPDERLAILMSVGQLEDRIVGIAAKRQRRHGIDHLPLGDVSGGRQDRPLALALAQSAPMLSRFQFVRAKFHGLPKSCLRLLHESGIFHHATDVLQRQVAIEKLIRRRLRCFLRKALPLLNGKRRHSGILIGKAEIDMGGTEHRIVFQRRLHGGDGARNIVHLPQQNGEIEADHMLARMRFIEGEPGLVELCRLLAIALRRQRFREFQQVHQRKALGSCKLQQSREERILGCAANRCIHCIQNLQTGRTAGGGTMAVIDWRSIIQ